MSAGLDCAVWDYGVGNLHSISKALGRLGARPAITTSPHRMRDADVAVLPGVGAFGHVIQSLEPVRDILVERSRTGRPSLGVCIGMQVLYEGSDEDPQSRGLGIIPGRVRRLPDEAGKVPHMGWSTLEGTQPSRLVAAASGKHVYYVHSYAAPVGPSTLAQTRYGDDFAAAVQTGPGGATVGFQFHPEKSGPVGARVLAAALDHFAGVLA